LIFRIPEHNGLGARFRRARDSTSLLVCGRSVAMQVLRLCALFLAAATVLQPATAALVGDATDLAEMHANREREIQPGCEDPVACPTFIKQIKEVAKAAEKLEVPRPKCVDDVWEATVMEHIDKLQPPSAIEADESSHVAPSQHATPPASLHAQQMARKGEFLVMDFKKSECETKGKMAVAAAFKKQATQARKEAVDLYKAASDESNDQAKAAMLAAKSAADKEQPMNVEDMQPKLLACKNKAKMAAMKLEKQFLKETTMKEMSEMVQRKKFQAEDDAKLATEAAVKIAQEAHAAVDKMSTTC